MKFGKRLKIIRKRNKLTQQQLGILIGLNPSSADVRIAQYENNLRMPKQKILSKIVEVLNVSECLLLSNHDDGMINIYIDLYWQLIEGKNIIYITELFEIAKLLDSERFEEFERIIK